MSVISPGISWAASYALPGVATLWLVSLPMNRLLYGTPRLLTSLNAAPGTRSWANPVLLTYTKSMLARLALQHGRLISLVVTTVVSLLFLIVPVYSSGGTLVEVNGPRVFGILTIPIVIALVPLVFPRLKISAAIVMLVFALIAGFSIGFFYLPAAMLLAWPERR